MDVMKETDYCTGCDRFLGSSRSLWNAYELGYAVAKADIRNDSMVFRCGHDEVYEIHNLAAQVLKPLEAFDMGWVYDATEVRALAKKLKKAKHG